MKGFLESLRIIMEGNAYSWLNQNPEGVLKAQTKTLLTHSNIISYGESQSLRGESDIEIVSNNNIYIIEFKVNRSAQEAIKQIREKYVQKYKGQNVTIIGINLKTKDKDDLKHKYVEFTFLIEKL